MTRNRQILTMIGYFLFEVMERLKEEGDKREAGLTYQRDQFVSDVMQLQSMINLMHQLLYLQAIESLIQTYYYNRRSETNKQAAAMNKLLWHMINTIFDNLYR